jgi:hypothetical protein
MQILLALIILVGCGSNNPVNIKRADAKIEPDLQGFYDEFLEYSREHGGIVRSILHTMTYVDSIENTDNSLIVQGECAGRSISIRRIPRDDGIPWDRVALRTVVFHELGHCLLLLEHTAMGSGQIMDPVMQMSPKYMEYNWDELVRYEFASGAK